MPKPQYLLFLKKTTTSPSSTEEQMKSAHSVASHTAMARMWSDLHAVTCSTRNVGTVGTPSAAPMAGVARIAEVPVPLSLFGTSSAQAATLKPLGTASRRMTWSGMRNFTTSPRQTCQHRQRRAVQTMRTDIELVQPHRLLPATAAAIRFRHDSPMDAPRSSSIRALSEIYARQVGEGSSLHGSPQWPQAESRTTTSTT